MKINHTQSPWHRHDMEAFTVCGPDHMSVAFAKAKSRSVDENFGNTILICSASEAPHECDIPGCPGDLNRRKLELFNEMAETLWFAYARALQARDQDSELINKLCSVIEKTKELK